MKPTVSQRTDLAPLFGWRHLVSSRDGPKEPGTRHVLLTLSLYMSPKGTSCFPSITTLMENTRLSRKTVIRHLELARLGGWITRKVTPMPEKGRGWRRHSYSASFPKNRAREKPPSSAQAEKDPQRGGVPSTPPHPEVVYSPPEGGVPDDLEVVYPVHPMSSGTSPLEEEAPQPEMCLPPTEEDAEPSPGELAEVLQGYDPPPTTRALIREALAEGRNAWETKFLRSVSEDLAMGRKLTGSQPAKLAEVLGLEEPLTQEEQDAEQESAVLQLRTAERQLTRFADPDMRAIFASRRRALLKKLGRPYTEPPPPPDTPTVSQQRPATRRKRKKRARTPEGDVGTVTGLP